MTLRNGLFVPLKKREKSNLSSTLRVYLLLRNFCIPVKILLGKMFFPAKSLDYF